MAEILNPPENILANLSGAPDRMKLVDSVIGVDLTESFARGISGILAHADFHDGCVCSLAPDNEKATDVAIQLFNAAAELETGWNAIRLANVPASFRQSRVGLECVAVAVMMSLPRPELERLPSKLHLVKALIAHPDMSVADLYKPKLKKQGKLVQRTDPKLKGSAILEAFLVAADRVLHVPSNVLNGLRQHLDDVLHPASHSSMDIFAYHFEDFGNGGKAGARFSTERAGTFRNAAANLANLSILLSQFLDRVVRYYEQGPSNRQQEV